MSRVTLALSQYLIQPLSNWHDYSAKITELVKAAKSQGAQLLLLPEYAGMELTAWQAGNLQLQFSKIQALLEDYIKLFSDLAVQYQLYIQPGTIPVTASHTQFYNRAYLFGSNCNYDFQDKIHLTKFEKQSQLIQPGSEIKIFNTSLGILGISICYDSEFSLLVQRQVTAGAILILVPSCTDNLSGYHRVRICCRARAIENQCFVAHTSLIGAGPWCEFIDINVGKSGVFGPADNGFPSHGIIAQAAMNQPQLLITKLSLT